MRQTRQEFANPREWLIRLAEESNAYSRLVAESGGMARAAYRLARARSKAQGSEPCLEDLQAATTLLASVLGGAPALPITSLLPGARSAPPPAPSSLRRSATGSRPRERSSRAHA